jgi:hypothetical protein
MQPLPMRYAYCYAHLFHQVEIRPLRKNRLLLSHKQVDQKRHIRLPSLVPAAATDWMTTDA